MVEATLPIWKDLCERCGRGFAAGEPRWIEQRRFVVHTDCADWSKWEHPPYSWKLRELRNQYRSADATERAGIVKAGTAIRQAQAEWPAHAVEHVRRVLEAVRGLGLGTRLATPQTHPRRLLRR
jgi:hypothetical protein